MATTVVNWNESNSLRSASTVAAGGTDTHNLDINGLSNQPDLVLLQFDVTDSGSDSVTVNIYSSSDGGSLIDNISILGFETDGTGTQEKQTVKIEGYPYIRVELVNNDGSNATGNISITYSHRHWVTT